MNLPQLYYFKKLAEVQHYTHAAKELYITQPTLSNSISQLERELEVPLFEREGRAVKLTRYGAEFCCFVTDALKSLNKGIDIAHEHAGSLSGTLEIGTIYTVQGDYLPALLTNFRSEYGSKIVANIHQGLTLPLIENLENDCYEIAFSAFVSDKPELTFIPVFTQQLVAIMHASHPLAKKSQVSFDDLGQASKLCTYPPLTPLGQEVLKTMQDQDLRSAPPYYNDEITLASMIESDPQAVGLSLNTIGLLPFHSIAVKHITGIQDNYHPICMAYKTSAFKTRALENLIAFVKHFEWQGNRLASDSLNVPPIRIGNSKTAGVSMNL